LRINTILTLSASAAFGLFAVFLARGWINEAIDAEFRQTTPVNGPVQAQSLSPVVVTTSELTFGTHITPDMLELAFVPADSVPEGSFASLDTLFLDPSQRTVVLSRMAMNEAIVDFRISGPGGRGSLSALITEGKRAAAIRVNDVEGVAGFVVPGDYVDILYTRDEQARRNGNTLTSDIFLQNVKVLGINQNLNDQSADTELAKTVTLEVTNEEAQKLHLAQDTGKLSMTLRRAGEVTVEPTQTVDQRNLLRSKGAKPVRRSPAPRRAIVQKVKPDPVSGVASVTIIRGDERDEVSVIREDINIQTNDELAGG